MNRRAVSFATKVGGGVLGVAIWLALWQWATVAGPLEGVSGIPTMANAVSEAGQLAGDADFWSGIRDTVTMAVAGLVTAFVVGLVVGIITGLSRSANEATDPLIQFLRPLPAIVILPLALLILGPTWDLGVFLAAFGAVWPILIQVQVGVRDIDPVAMDVARAMTLPWLKIQTAIVLPSAAPYIVTGVRIAASAALMLSIGAGLLGGAPGLGRQILLAQQANQSDLAFGLILWSGILGLALAIGLGAAERAFVRGRSREDVA